MDKLEINAGMKVRYLGALRCEATHIKSGNKLTSDAPPDNNGKGEAFSPTDLLSTSLACCMITLMGIAAANKNIQLGKIDADIEKVMLSEPRRVGEIKIAMRIEDCGYSDRERAILENAAKTCPVAKSLSSEIKQSVDFIYY